MDRLKKCFLGAAVASVLSAPIWAQSLSAAEEDRAEAAQLLQELADPALRDWRSVEGKLTDIWARSGSATVDLMFKRGEDALEDDRLDDAIEYFSAVIDHAPDFAEGWNGRATAFFLADDYGLALHDIRMALSLNPNHFGSLVGLGVIHGEMENYKAAIEAYERAKALNPHQEEIDQGIKHLSFILGRATL